MEFTKFIRDTIAEQLQRGGNIRVFANSRYQDITEVTLDGCGGIILKVGEVKPEQTFAEIMDEHQKACNNPHDGYGWPATKA